MCALTLGKNACQAANCALVIKVNNIKYLIGLVSDQELNFKQHICMETEIKKHFVFYKHL